MPPALADTPVPAMARLATTPTKPTMDATAPKPSSRLDSTKPATRSTPLGGQAKISPFTVKVAPGTPLHINVAVRVVALAFAILTPVFTWTLGLGVTLWARAKTLTKNPATAPVLNPVLDVLADFVTNYRAIFVTLVINPICLAWDVVGNVEVRRAIHEERVRHVQQQVKDLVAQGATRLCTARPGFLVMSVRAPNYKKKWAGVDVQALRDVIEIDEEREVVIVEPGCTMGRLSRELISRGWTIQVLPELDELTVGGLINGFGIETSSHKYGLFQHTCTAFEVVLPSGELLRCDKDNHTDLFSAIPWSHGTIGFLTAAEIKLVRAHPYVRLEYRPCMTAKDASNTFEQACRDNAHDFVESLVYSRNTAVVMTGKMVPRVPKGEVLNEIGKWYKPWFFAHVQGFLSKPRKDTPYVECIPLRDYYHRHTRSIFWEMKDIVPKGNSAWYRWLFAWAGPPKVALLKLSSTGKIHEYWVTKHVVQDLLVPMITLDTALDFFHRELDVYPLWLCPMRMLSPAEDLLALRRDPSPTLRQCIAERGGKKVAPDQPVTTPKGSFTPPHPCDQLYVDVGAYGVPRAPGFHHVRTLEKIEAFVRSVQGFSACYADIVGTRDEFRQMFDHRNYDAVREKYGATKLLPEVHEKVHKSARD
ncbi:hypothetical protein BCR44DRAFT_1457128 [Catenaria anguillulae PL171]|uniref:Delta(24)-sterol reductase n=1 Tax=Catenaria anguillulae PL171 TaxID=765915 RepID=A0A1Y2I3Z5_9FUNG|nr:hypothetical protein BCR44DRAFT_1457128 [Catenaria anguillulae PL171]